MIYFGGLPVTVSLNATERTGPYWPVRQRSKRLHKKLMKKRGPQFFDKPAAFKTPYGLIVHPDIYAEFEKRMSHDQYCKPTAAVRRTCLWD
jgi:hypothetical protein